MSRDDITNQTYDQIAASFADRYWNLTLDRALNSFAALVKTACPVLDIGCGPGRDVWQLRQRGLLVFGADRSAGMITEAQRRVGGALIMADMRDLPFCAGMLGGVWMCASLLHISRAEVPEVLAEARRVLRPGGVLYISVREGVGEEWSESDGGRRFFTLFQSEEIQTFVRQAKLAVKEHWVEPGGHSMWISVLAARLYD